MGRVRGHPVNMVRREGGREGGCDMEYRGYGKSQGTPSEYGEEGGGEVGRV